MNETNIQNAIAVKELIMAIVEKYNLPKEEVFELATKTYIENMQFKDK
jgi:hypothetical protein